MNKTSIKGKLDEVAGSAKRTAGELIGDTRLESEGMTQQMKGKVENAWGKTKEAVHDAAKNIEAQIDKEAQLKSHDSIVDVEQDNKG